MDFAPEPVLEAVTPPPTRAARVANTDDNGQTFSDHLDAMDEPPPERPAPAPRSEKKDKASSTQTKAAANEDTPDQSDQDETIDSEVALLGGPQPAAPPPLTAPVIVQIVASQPSQQQPQAQAQPQDGEANTVAPVAAPQVPSLDAPSGAETPGEDGATAQPADQSEANADKSERPADVRPPQQHAQLSAPQTPAAQTPAAQPSVVTSQISAPPPQTAPVASEAPPEVLQQAIAATTSPLPQPATQPANGPRTSKDAKQQVEAKALATNSDAKSEAPANVKATAPKASDSGSAKSAIAPVLLTQDSSPEPTQSAQSNTITTTAAQTTTHVQHAAADASAQRTVPVAAQVGHEIIRRFSGGATSFELRLDPADLGRVDVRMEVTRDNRVTALITADNPQALTELARHARDLEQQLQSAGLQLSDNGLSFDLRQGAQGGENSEQGNSSARGEASFSAPQQERQAAPVARPIGYERWRGVRVDMMV
ncbi:MAG: flagellar hook-length control protein FliK [Hyphomonadaceae bacterium]